MVGYKTDVWGSVLVCLMFLSGTPLLRTVLRLNWKKDKENIRNEVSSNYIMFYTTLSKTMIAFMMHKTTKITTMKTMMMTTTMRTTFS